MIYVVFIIVILYSLLILFFSRGVDRMENFRFVKEVPKVSFSVIIPFRNEAVNLPSLLKSISELDYPSDKYEIILINDSSNDNSVSIIEAFIKNNPETKTILIENKRNSSSPKKDAIEIAIDSCSFNWVVTTDADCILPKLWLRSFDLMIEEKSPKMIVAPVSYIPQSGFLHKFQLLDFLSLQGITIGSLGMKDKKTGHPFLCNGANLCYNKESFKEVNGFKGNHHIPSGDDVFLLEKMYQNFPNRVEFLKSKEAIVLTAAKDSFKELIQQRVRWAAKTTAYSSIFTRAVGILVFLTNLSVVSVFILGSFGQLPWIHVGFVFILKFNIDFILLFKTAQFFEQQDVMKSYFVSSLFYPFYTVLVALLSLRKNYTWKGRTY